MIKLPLIPVLFLCFIFNAWSQEKRKEEREIRVKNELKNWKFQGGNEQLEGHKINFNDKGWENVELPHSWVKRTEQRNLNYSDAWYRTTKIFSEAHEGKRIYLFVERAAINADIFVNEEKIGSHKGGYTSFIFDITNQVVIGKENLISIKLDDRFDIDAMPANAFGGLTGKVFVLSTNNYHIDPSFFASSGVFITPIQVDSEQAFFAVKTFLKNAGSHPKNFTIKHTLRNDQGEDLLTAEIEKRIVKNDSIQVQMQLKNPSLWSPLTPYLYQLITELYVDGLLVDVVNETTGFRDFAITADNFKLNGSPFQILGANYTHPVNEELGAAMTDKAIEADLDTMKHSLGFNSVRFAHWPFPKAAYKLADEKGLLVMTENGYSWTEDITLGAEGQHLTKEMVYQNYNHPSIAFWSSGNENPHDGYKFYSQVIREADSTRIVVSVDDKNDFITAGKLNIPFDYHDAVFQNKYLGWYEGEPWDFDKFTKVLHLIGETGAGSLRTNHQPYAAKGHTRSEFEPEEFAQLVYEAIMQTTFVNSPEQVDALFIWHFRDVFSGKYKGYNTKGLVAAGNFKKDTYYLYQSFLRPDAKVLQIVGKHWYFRENEDDLKVYSNAEEVFVSVNGKLIESRTNGDFKHQIYDNQVVNNVFYWEDILLPGRNEILVKDERGNTDRAVIYIAAIDTVPYLEINTPITDLQTSSPQNSAHFYNAQIHDQWPVYKNEGDRQTSLHEADNTFMELPALLSGCGMILTRRQSDKSFFSGLSFEVANQATEVFLMIDDTESTPLFITRSGFKETTAVGTWRDNSSQIKNFKIYMKKFLKGEKVEIQPTAPVDFVVFIK